MPAASFRLMLVSICLAVGAQARVTTEKTRLETVFLFQNRKVTFAVPQALGIASSKDAHGLMTVRISDRKEKAMLQIVFAPDPDDELGSERARRDRMFELFRSYAEGSVEQAMRFEELAPRRGAGTFCVFTDASLVGKKVPPGEYLNYTAGVKVWPGVCAIFTILSNDTTSKEYRALMELLRDSVEEQPAPLK